MKHEERAVILALIKTYCRPSRYYYRWSSYGLKEVFERLAGCYIGNADFKALMQEAGFEPTPTSRDEINHRYQLEVKPCPEIDANYWGVGCNAPWYNRRCRHG